MPELPEVETSLRGISPYLLGQVIEKIIVRNKRLRWEVSDELENIQGAKILAIARRAKYLIIYSNRGDIIVHLGMSGTLRIIDRIAELNKHDHIDLITKSGIILRYNDPRRFGCWLWAKRASDLPLIANLGPEPLGKTEFCPSYLFQQTRRKNKAIKNLIMDNKIVVGVGNIYACESLFLAKIHPEIPSQNLTLNYCSRLVETIQQVLASAIEQGGTTLKDFRQPDGKLGYFAQVLQVYGRNGEACRNCSTQIQAKIIGQRNSFFCPHCQKI